LGLERAGEDGYRQPIPPIAATNLLARIPGRSHRTVILGAHYDACGWDNPGADDNAAAVAITVEVARRLRDMDLERTVVIALFDAEEPPYFLSPEMGSQWFVDHPTVPLADIDTMVCLDLVGHAVGPQGAPDSIRDSVFVLGAEKSSGTGTLIDALPAVPGIRPRRIDNYVIESMSDYDAFMNSSVPFLFYTCGRSEHYHAPTDTPDRLDYPKMESLAVHLVDLMHTLANRSGPVVYVSGGIDDRATTHTLLEMLSELADAHPLAGQASVLLESLHRKAHDDGGLDVEDRQLIAQVVMGVESTLA